jgi:hypothetical protein
MNAQPNHVMFLQTVQTALDHTFVIVKLGLKEMDLFVMASNSIVIHV